MTVITGTTGIWAILADPIGHVKTPENLNALMTRMGVDGALIPLHVSAANLPTVVGGLRPIRNLHGFVVTVPHKTAIVDLCDEISPRVRAVGAANVVRKGSDGRLACEILDGLGFVAGISQSGLRLRGMTVYLAGAGGAANAIAFALAEAGIAALTIANRTEARSLNLQARLAVHHPSLAVRIGGRDPSGHDLVINATSLGLRPDDPLPLAVELLTGGQIVAEIIMQPPLTPLLLAARERGCRLHTGLPMLTCQLELMADFMGIGRRFEGMPW